jgi:HK97 family phage portal protein
MSFIDKLLWRRPTVTGSELVALEQAQIIPKRPITEVRAHPAQIADANAFLYAARPELYETIAHMAYTGWVATAVDRIASRAAAAEVWVEHPDNKLRRFPEHPFLRLLGARGVPSDDTDSFEFWETHYTNFLGMGNVYWWWETASNFGGEPQMVHHLEPEKVRIVPGRDRRVSYYLYEHMGVRRKLFPYEITHFRRANPESRYYGLSMVHAIIRELRSDRAMVDWNEQFFGEDVAVPAGIVVIPADTKDEERDRLADEMSGRYGTRRRTAVLRAEQGSVAYYQAGLAPHDMDFKDGRLLSRQVVYEALGLPLGLLSEASTEAHARVAERQFAHVIGIWQRRTATKINSDAMSFWPLSTQRQVAFEDLAQKNVDWDRELKRVDAMRGLFEVNEIRQQVFNSQPLTDAQLKQLQGVGHENMGTVVAGVAPGADVPSDEHGAGGRDSNPGQSD